MAGLHWFAIAQLVHRARVGGGYPQAPLPVEEVEHQAVDPGGQSRREAQAVTPRSQPAEAGHPVWGPIFRAVKAGR